MLGHEPGKVGGRAERAAVDLGQAERRVVGGDHDVGIAGETDAAVEVAALIAAKSPTVIRAAKESLNGIDLWDVKRSYRYEQGFTFELNLSGASDELREAFVEKRDADTSN